MRSFGFEPDAQDVADEMTAEIPAPPFSASDFLLKPRSAPRPSGRRRTQRLPEQRAEKWLEQGQRQRPFHQREARSRTMVQGKAPLYSKTTAKFQVCGNLTPKPTSKVKPTAHSKNKVTHQGRNKTEPALLPLILFFFALALLTALFIYFLTNSLPRANGQDLTSANQTTAQEKSGSASQDGETAGEKRGTNQQSIEDQPKQGLTMADFLTTHPLVKKVDDLILVNVDHPLPRDFQPRLLEYENTGMKMQAHLLEALTVMARDVAQQTGDQLQLESAHRTTEEQRQVYALNPKVAALPGASEHETGLAIDLSSPLGGHYEFAQTPAGQFVAAHAWQYGFIIRYPEDKVDLTGIPYEPWHLRYVGKIHAAIMKEQNWCLEEYIQNLAQHDFFVAKDYRIYRRPNYSQDLPTTWEDLLISKDNTGAYILTYQGATD